MDEQRGKPAPHTFCDKCDRSALFSDVDSTFQMLSFQDENE